MTPSTEWREQIVDGEQQRFEEAGQRLAEIQRVRSQKYGAGRALHRKQSTCARGTLTVLAGLPAHAAQGLFATPGPHDAWVRLSNGSMDIASDRTPDIRGFAMKVFGVDGESALGGPAKSQDFVLINREVFGFATPEPFFGLVIAASNGAFSVIKHFVKTHGFFAGLKALGALQKGQKRPFAGFAADSFFSAAPIKNGPYAVRVRLVPEGTPPRAASTDDYGKGFAAILAKGPLAYALQLQFFVDEKTTPIEDASIDWSESAAPYVTVARLELPQQDTDDAFADGVGKAAFDPWCALAAHRPLGGIMRARKVAYYASQKGRGVG